MYSKIIDEPMDLSTMSKKIDNFQYKCMAAFEYDIALICRNCCHYNDSQTIFYRLGQDYKAKTTAWLKNVIKKAKEERFNTATGTFLAEGAEMDSKPEYDFHLEWYNRLLVRYADLEKEKNSSARTKLLKACKHDQGRVRRLLQKLGHDFDAEDLASNGPTSEEIPSSSRSSGSNNDNLSNGIIPTVQPNTNGLQNISGAHAKDTSNGHNTNTAHANGPTNGPSENGVFEHGSNGVFEGPKIEENGNIVMHDSEQEIKGDSQVIENQVSGNQDDHLQNFQPLDLVWAKCPGYPWYPALIFDADLGQNEPILHGDEELPQPSFDIIELGNKLNTNPEEQFNLVLFFDARRTWQWLPRNKIALLGKDREFDSQKKNEGKTAALRKSVQKAYSRATQQAQNI